MIVRNETIRIIEKYTARGETIKINFKIREITFSY